MNNKLLLTYTLTLFSSIVILGQSKRVADRYFNEYAYVQAAKLYEAIYKQGDSSKYILKRLGDSYYNNSETVKAENWYSKLIEKHSETELDYLFKYAQVLRSNRKYQKSDSLFLIIADKKELKNIKEKVSEGDYLLDFSNNKNKRISIRNLALNTPYSDFGGFLYNEDVYFASASPKEGRKQRLYKWNNQPFLNIYKAYSFVMPLEDSEKDSVFELEDKVMLPEPLNTQYHESTPIITKDGKTMYFTRVNYDGRKLRKDKKATVNLKLYKAQFSKGYWLNIQELPFNSDQYSVGHPALSPDEKTLYFVSDMPGGIGETDIYKVAITESGYSEPINLGTTINTLGKEMFPFVGDDNTLYFSSNGHLGYGLLDIYQTKIKENNVFSKAINLGSPFNSTKDDFSFYIDKKGKKGFFSSNRPKGKGDDDIYSFIIYEEPACNQVLEGIVTNTIDKNSIAEASIKLIANTGEVIDETVTDTKGYYQFKNIPCSLNKITIVANKLDYKSDNKNTIELLQNGKVVTANLQLRPLIVGNQIVIKPIYFDYNKSEIRDDAQYELENIVTVMSNHPNMVIKIESHTDSRGNKDYNRKLSDRRAKSTRNYIISRGIAPNRIVSAIGYGEDQLLNHCNDENSKKCTEEEHQLNRRSYFYIVSDKNKVNSEK
ncbi:OmpA family protein [Tenacibaculum sp. IB213877]|uniref:OmpA family protein n=1 Tax=Tenacibaculum sp. IB213877 TaxID=3097351 RepID=UPI002A5AD114|nr:OmpA family protein [Tenacibaculum sp. IB213877]MDY0781666.1 OmpA family protein [Tenacibaculum sp. IB213877]